MSIFSVYGLGSGGSKVVDMLARHFIMGQRKASFHLYDHDEVSEFNVWNQLYTFEHINMAKIGAMRLHLRTLEHRATLLEGSVIDIWSHHEDKTPQGITLVMVDSMKARKKIYQMWKEEAVFDSKVLIENRLDSECVCTYVVSRNDYKRYEATLYEDPPEDPNRDVCKVRESSYISTLNAVLAVKYALKGGVDCPFETQIGLADPIQVMVRK